LSPDGDALPSCKVKTGKLWPTARNGNTELGSKVVAYRLIGKLRRDGHCYMIKAWRELVQVRVQQAVGNVSHWRGTQGLVCV
jgi:hypothetical protein